MNILYFALVYSLIGLILFMLNFFFGTSPLTRKELIFWPVLLVELVVLAGISVELFIIIKQKKKHNEAVIVTVDFDQTLIKNGYTDIEQGYTTFLTRSILYLCKYLQANNHIVILNTLREGDLLSKAKSWLEYHFEFTPNYCNNNDEANMLKWKADPRKIAAHYNFDDLNAGLLGFLLRAGF